MGTHNQTDPTMKGLFILSIFISQSFGQECSPPLPAECADTEIRCDMGTWGSDYCWMGDYCMPEGSYCPPACHIPAPSNCTNGDIVCDMGSTAGCWMGDYCMPVGTVCPVPCYSPAPSHCMNGDIVCDMGSTGGCWNGNYCMPQGSVCPPVCHSPAPSHCLMGEVVCDMGSTSACQRVPSVPQHVTPLNHPTVWRETLSVTWGHLLRDVGWEITACQRDLSVQLSAILLCPQTAQPLR